MKATQDGLKARQVQYTQRLGSLAYERIKLQRQIKDIDHDIAALEGAIQADEATQKDVLTDIAIAQAQEKEIVEAAEQKGAKKK